MTRAPPHRPCWQAAARSAIPRIELTVRSQSLRAVEQAVYPVHVTARDIQCLVMLADCFLVRAVQQAVNLALGVVVKLDLPHAELVDDTVPRSLSYLVDGFVRKLQIIVVIHEPGHCS